MILDGEQINQFLEDAEEDLMRMDSQAVEAFNLAQTFSDYEAQKAKELEEQKALLKIKEASAMMRASQVQDGGAGDDDDENQDGVKDNNDEDEGKRKSRLTSQQSEMINNLP